MDAIKVEKLVKKFGKFTAVDNISFSVKEGELFGLLGPNGAGKTTTINMLATLLKPTSGYAEVAGHDVTKKTHEVRQNIGIVFQDPALDTKLTGRENLEFHSMIYNIRKKEMDERIQKVLELVELTDKANVLVEKYSGGMKRRLEIARGLIHQPKVLFLDEPTIGLDAQTRRYIWDYIKKLNKENKVTIILTTHYMEEADYLCDKVAIVDHGKIVAIDTTEKLKDNLGGDVVTMEASGDIDKFLKILASTAWIKKIKRFNHSVSLTMEKADTKIPKLVSMAQKINVTIESVNLRKPSLEDVFLHFTGKTMREQEGSASQTHMDMMRRRMGAR